MGVKVIPTASTHAVVEIDPQKGMPPSMLISAAYEGPSKKAILKFYHAESQSLFLWRDETDHKPYCYTKIEPDELDSISGRNDVIRLESVTKRDLISDADCRLTKIVVDDPLAIGGGSSSKQGIRNIIETWESDIKYYETYIYDRQIIVGRYYAVRSGRLEPTDMEISDEVQLSLKSLLWGKVVPYMYIYTEVKSEQAFLWQLPLYQSCGSKIRY